ncbi:glutathione S-transferase family protein [Dokdonella fugitiva]|jgi:glutathione S-transferase|uniref:glutathione S-transferase family protein n=1 Tax=Dokdonella fugitiva TaxID=328517 RepID=UPI0015FCD2CB|nr:glutathione S-transferase family protein [Dokdonella fugitiva]MBA8884363.1 glutathione S-transferase [Dokdonella fugitiva]
MASRPALYAHPFSSYSQKVLIALYENDIPFEYRNLESEEHRDALARLWPLRRFPVLVDDGRTIVEATTIIEHLALRHPGPVALLPHDREAALEVRALDRFFDNYVSTPQQKVVFDRLRPEADRDPYGVAEARAMLETAYAWLERHMVGRTWAVGDTFTLADCAAAPFLFYADWTHPLGDRFPNVGAYRRRLLARPSFARAVEEARPFRPYFPLGAPDRD